MHHNHLVAKVTAGSAQTLQLLRGMQANFYAHGADAATASRKSLAAIYGLVQQHAAMLAFVEVFWIMGVVFLLMLPFLPLLQYSKLRRAAKPASNIEKVASTSKLGQTETQPANEKFPEQEVLEEEHHLVLH